MKPSCRWLVVMLAVAGLNSALAAQEPSRVGEVDCLTIYLKQRVQIAEALVRIGDVAIIDGGTAAARQRAAALDLAELTATRSEVVVPRSQVEFRLRLAGWDTRQFRILGADVATVKGHAKPAVDPTSPKNIGPAKYTPPPTESLVPAKYTPPPTESLVVIKARDPVRIVAELAGYRVTARGEALDNGQLGQLIRIRNIDTGRIVMARVVDRNLAEVDY